MTHVVPGSGAMFDQIAPRYDLLNRLISLGGDHRWRRLVARSVLAGTSEAPTILDVATGTADVALEIARLNPSARVCGLDPSGAMLAIGRQKVTRRGVNDRVELIEGDGLDLPFADRSFDACCISFGIRNIADRLGVLEEMVRVTRGGGTVAVLELGEPKGRLLASLARWHVHSVVPRLGAWLSGAKQYRYLQESIAAFPEPDVFTELMQRAGIREITWRSLSLGAVSLFVGTSRTDAVVGSNSEKL